MCYKSLFTLLITLNLIDLGLCYAQSDNMKAKLCHTWVSYEQTFHSKLLNEVVTRETTGREIDSLIVSENFKVQRFHRNKICNGTWNFSDDSTKAVFLFSDCRIFYYSMRPDEFVLGTLSGGRLKMLCNFGEEGEYTERWFRIGEK